MKFLKSYRLFESSDEKISDEIFNDVNDILLEIKDMGIDIELKNGLNYYPNPSSKAPSILIHIESEVRQFFYISDDRQFRFIGNISDCLLRLKDYVNKNGCEMIMLNVPDDNNENDYHTVDEFFEIYKGEELYEIEIIIYKK